MINVENIILDYLSRVENNKEIFTGFSPEFHIASKINEIIKESEARNLSANSLNEQMAFDFLPDYPKNETSWGTYYGPKWIMPNAEGIMIEYPSIQRINEDTIKYWTKRATQVHNPILKNRYCDLILDFSKKISGKNPPILIFQNVIDSAISIVRNSLTSELDSIKKLKRALDISLKCKDDIRIESSALCMIDLEKRIGVDNKPGLWGFSLKSLVLNKSRKKIGLNDTQTALLIKDLEARLARSEDIHIIKSAATPLLEYYSLINDEINLRRILLILKGTYESDKRMNSEALITIHNYEEILKIYQKYENKFPSLKKDSEDILKEMSSLNLDWKKSMKKVSSSVTIEKSKIENYVNIVFGQNNQYSQRILMGRIGTIFIPNRKTLEERLKETAKKTPFNFLITTQVISEEGYHVATMNSLDDDYEKHFNHFANQDLTFQSLMISFIMEELRKRLSEDKVIAYFKSSLLFKNENSEYISKSLNAYWREDYLISSHLFIPLIESAIRMLIKISGGITIKANELGGYDSLLLHQLLKNEQIFNGVYGVLGKNMLFYFKMVLTEKLGMNLRNDFAHGLNKSKFLSSAVSDRLFHILICLSLVEDRKN
jgi:hypothetical protein